MYNEYKKDTQLLGQLRLVVWFGLRTCKTKRKRVKVDEEEQRKVETRAGIRRTSLQIYFLL